VEYSLSYFNRKRLYQYKMAIWLSDFQRSLLLVALAWALLFSQQSSNLFQTEFAAPSDVSSSTDVLTRVDMNAAGHVYPYTATAVTFSCLLAVTMIIICMGGQLG
jgi:hypothetical protein